MWLPSRSCCAVGSLPSCSACQAATATTYTSSTVAHVCGSTGAVVVLVSSSPPHAATVASSAATVTVRRVMASTVHVEVSVVADELRTAAKKLKSIPNQMVRAGANTLAKPLRASYKADTGGDSRLSGIGNARLTVATSARGAERAKGYVKMRPAGPASWLNYGTRPRRQGSGWHPGTPAKRTFDAPVDREIRNALREMERLFERSLR